MMLDCLRVYCYYFIITIVQGNNFEAKANYLLVDVYKPQNPRTCRGEIKVG